MRIASVLSSGQFGKRPLLAFGTLVVGAFAAYELAQYVINDDMNGLAYAGLCLAGGAIVVAILNNWRNGVIFLPSLAAVRRFCAEIPWQQYGHLLCEGFSALVVYSSFIAAFRGKEVPFSVPRL